MFWTINYSPVFRFFIPTLLDVTHPFFADRYEFVHGQISVVVFRVHQGGKFLDHSTICGFISQILEKNLN